MVISHRHPILGQLEFSLKMDEKMIFSEICRSEDAVSPKISLSYPLIIILKECMRRSIGTLQIAAEEFQTLSVFALIQKITSGELDQLGALSSFAAFSELFHAIL